MTRNAKKGKIMDEYGQGASNLGVPMCETAKTPAPMSLTEKVDRQAEAIKNLQQGLDNAIKRLNRLEQIVGV
jgi:hypothetical protein